MRSNPKIVSLDPVMAAAAGLLVPNAPPLDEVVWATADTPGLLRQVGIQHPYDLEDRELGRGAYARAFSTPSGKVLKLTTDPADAAVSQLVAREGPLRGLVGIEAVYRMPAQVREHRSDAVPSADLYAIIVEQVMPLEMLLEKLADEEAPDFDPALVDEWFDQADQLEIARAVMSSVTGMVTGPFREHSLMSKEQLLATAMREGDEDGLDETGMLYLYDLVEGWYWMARHGFRMADLHAGNVGFTQDGRAVLIDLGLSAKGVRPELELAMNPSSVVWAYHATEAHLVRDIARSGLEPRVDSRGYYAADGPLLQFGSSAEAVAEYGSVMLRFPWPADAEWTVQGAEAVSRHRVSPAVVEAWVPSLGQFVPLASAPVSELEGADWSRGWAPTGKAALAENPSPKVDRIFDECFDRIEEMFGDFGTVEFYEDEKAGSDNGAGADRQFAYCQDGHPISIAFAPKAAKLERAQLLGLMRHEFGHALEYRYGVKEMERRLGRRLPEKVERRADAIAEAVWGEPIVYDERLVQCVGVHGTRPRPNHLPDEKAKLKANGLRGSDEGVQYEVFKKTRDGVIVRAYETNQGARTLIGNIVAGRVSPYFLDVNKVSVRPEATRRGIASKLYQMAARIGCEEGWGPLRSKDYQRSRDATNTWESLVRRGVAERHGEAYVIPCDSIEGGADERAKLKPNPPSGTQVVGYQLPLAETSEDGVRFVTGEPVTFPITHRKQKTAHYGATYGQDVEPAGRYVVHGHWGEPGVVMEPGGHRVEVMHEVAHFEHPLVLQEEDWKRQLSQAYGGLTGKQLTKALLKDGYDGIVTVNRRGTSEIIQLGAPMRRNGEGDSVTLPAGSLLFHGSLEPFDTPLRPGGDGVLWFADSPAIAQLYIGCSGAGMNAGADAVGAPTKDPLLRVLQRFIGIHYDYDDVRFDNLGRATSWAPPEGFERTPTKAESVELLRRAGFTVPDGWAPRVDVNLYSDSDGVWHVIPPGQCREGRLFVARTLRDMRIYVMSKGEGDLNDVQYNEFDFFAELRQRGYDGLLIDDFAQSDAWGNLGHLSLGLFAEAARDLDVTSVPAQYHEFEMGEFSTPEYPEPVHPYFPQLRQGLTPNRSWQPPLIEDAEDWDARQAWFNQVMEKARAMFSGIPRVHTSPGPIEEVRSTPTSMQKEGAKPEGFWYACGLAWIEFQVHEMFRFKVDEHVYGLDIDYSRVLVIRNAAELLAFDERYGVDEVDETYPDDVYRWIDWPRVAREYKGIEICPYLPEFRRDPALTWYNGWDVASGCIWDVSAIKRIFDAVEPEPRWYEFWKFWGRRR